ncbi:hypothetical protein GCM10027273_10010 [Nocardioides pakistanensis]
MLQGMREDSLRDEHGEPGDRPRPAQRLPHDAAAAPDPGAPLDVPHTHRSAPEPTGTAHPAPPTGYDRAGNRETTLAADAAKVARSAKDATSPKTIAVNGALAATGMHTAKEALGVGHDLAGAAREETGHAGRDTAPPARPARPPQRHRAADIAGPGTGQDARPAPRQNRAGSAPTPLPAGTRKTSRSRPNVALGTAAKRSGLGDVHSTLLIPGEGEHSYTGAARDTAKGAKAGAKIGSAVPVAGTAAGAAVGGALGALKSKRGRRLMLGLALLPPVAVAMALFLLLSMVSGGAAASFKANDTAVALDAAEEAGVDPALVNTYYEASANRGVNWEFLAAIAHAANGSTEAPPADDLSKMAEDDEPIGPFGIKYQTARDTSTRYGVDLPEPEVLYDTEQASEFLAALFAVILAEETDGPSLDAGVVIAEDDESGHKLVIDTADEQAQADADDAQEQFTKALELLPVEAAETNAAGVFDTARSWHLGGQDSCAISGPTSGPSSIEGIPQVALDAYNKAAQASGIDWAVIAAIGFHEGSHGSANGATLSATGDIRPKILGVVLDGSTPGTSVIADWDNGRYDGNRQWERAIGPLQFLPQTWEAMAKDGNADGKIDPDNIFDSAMAAAFYLKASGAPADYDRAILTYNNSTTYLADIKAKAEEYRSAPAAPTASPEAGPAGAKSGPGSTPEPDSTNPAPEEDSDPGTDVGSGPASGAWTRPLDAGHEITSPFGMRMHPVLHVYKLHDGTDFGAAEGTPVYAIGDGVVETAGTPDSHWAGPNYVTINHGTVDGKSTSSGYGHMSAMNVTVGQQVKAGDLIGAVGNMGLSSGAHLHLQVFQDGTVVDPALFLTTAGFPVSTGAAGCGVGNFPPPTGDGAWGGYQNGQIPLEELQELSFSPGAYLRADAAQSLERLNDAFQAEFGKNIGPVGGYRPYEDQVQCQLEKGSLCATPGTSNHGWALAADLGANINVFGTPEHNWMVEHAGVYGWILPPWAQQGGSKPEPWHWQFGLTD